MKKINKFTGTVALRYFVARAHYHCASCQQDWQRLATVKKMTLEVKKRSFIFFIEEMKLVQSEFEMTIYLECGDFSPL